MIDERQNLEPSDFRDLVRTTLRLSLAYWACLFVADSILGYFINIDPVESAPMKFVLFGAGALMTYGFSLLLFKLRNLSFAQKALLSFLMTAIAAPLFVAVDFINYTICQYPKPVQFDPVYSGYMLIEGASILFGWSCLFIALLYSFEVRAKERRLAAIRAEAQAAQMQALRYQVNPHFLFNTLNSIAGLIEEGAAAKAERMVLQLSNFMRATLTLEPLNDISLADELALQEEYLEIERERFSDRMVTRIEASHEARQALVPSLILQPLVENAIKHGVSATRGRVEIALRALRRNDRLLIVLENDTSEAAGQRKVAGMGVGLRNVSERLRMRFQGNSVFQFGLVSPRRYRAEIDIPWRQA